MKIIVVCILYNPTDFMLQKWVEKVKNLPEMFFLFVDNSLKETYVFEGIEKNVAYIPCHKNLGIAAAQNIGINYAKANFYDYIVFFDQDSDFSIQYVFDMVSEYCRIKESYSDLIVLGPRIIDKKTLEEYKHNDSNSNNECFVCRELISSGSMVKTEAFDKIGLFEESLFIDYVDFEWCWRATNKGFLCVKTKRVSLVHEVGRQRLSLGGYPIILSSPIRYFFQYRNYFRLIKRSYVPLNWKKKVFVRKIFELFAIPFLYQKNPKIFYYMIKGTLIGLFTR